MDDEDEEPRPKVLVDDMKTTRFMQRYNIQSDNPDKSLFYHKGETMAKNMWPLIKCFTARILLDPDWEGNTDQSMQSSLEHREKTFTTNKAKRSHGRKKVLTYLLSSKSFA